MIGPSMSVVDTVTISLYSVGVAMSSSATTRRSNAAVRRDHVSELDQLGATLGVVDPARFRATGFTTGDHPRSTASQQAAGRRWICRTS